MRKDNRFLSKDFRPFEKQRSKNQSRNALYQLKKGILADALSPQTIALSFRLDSAQDKILFGLLISLPFIHIVTAIPENSTLVSSTVSYDGTTHLGKNVLCPRIETLLREKYHASQLEKKNEKLISTFSQFTRASQANACKLKEIMKDPSFKVRILNAEEFSGYDQYASFNEKENTIDVAYDWIDSPYMPSVLSGLLEHAFFASQHKAQNRLLYDASLKKPVVKASACKLNASSAKTGTVNCEAIGDIINAGLARVNFFLDVMNTRENTIRDPALKQAIADYKHAAADYIPLVAEIPLEHDTMLLLQQKGILDANLNVINRFFLDQEERYYVDNIQVRSGISVAQLKAKKIDSLSPLNDFFLLLKPLTQDFEKTNAIEKYISEIHALIHQVFGAYPKLINLLFKGLSEYDESLATSDYRSCLRQG